MNSATQRRLASYERSYRDLARQLWEATEALRGPFGRWASHRPAIQNASVSLPPPEADGLDLLRRSKRGARRKVPGVSEQPVSEAVPVLEELARDQHARPVRDIAELPADVWTSDEELDEFLADWRAGRDASLS